jgi:hypothetical protein
LFFLGIATIISALAAIPDDSSWGAIYSIIGSIMLLIGVSLLIKPVLKRVLCVAGCALLLFAMFSISDYVAVTQFNQVPRFSYEKTWSSDNPDDVIHKTLFFNAVQKNRGTEYQRVEIVR